MDKLLIRGGRCLQGEVSIAGAKNAALPALCAALLSAEPVILQNVPRLQDVSTMVKLIRNMGVAVERDEDGVVRVDASGLSRPQAPYELVKTMRRCSRWARCWRVSARPGYRCPAVAPLARGPWTSTSWA